MNGTVEQLAALAPMLAWEEERPGVFVGVRDGHTPREVVMRVEQIIMYHKRVWCAWLRAGPALGGLNFCAYGEDLEQALASARRIYKKDYERWKKQESQKTGRSCFGP